MVKNYPTVKIVQLMVGFSENDPIVSKTVEMIQKEKVLVFKKEYGYKYFDIEKVKQIYNPETILFDPANGAYNITLLCYPEMVGAAMVRIQELLRDKIKIQLHNIDKAITLITYIDRQMVAVMEREEEIRLEGGKI